MVDTRSRHGILVGFAAAVGAFGAAAMMSAASAPTARADDFTDVISNVDANYAAGQAALSTASADFSSGHLANGLAAFFDGSNDDSLSASNSFLIGTVDLLTNESVTGDSDWTFVLPTNYADAVTEAESIFADGENYLTDGASALAAGDYSTATADYLFAADYLTVAPLQELLLGAAVSF
jgi:hypothetical protein